MSAVIAFSPSQTRVAMSADAGAALAASLIAGVTAAVAAGPAADATADGVGVLGLPPHAAAANAANPTALSRDARRTVQCQLLGELIRGR
jgi:hypothetical protein